MNFSVQRYIEDYFHQRNLRDNDQFAVKLASLFMTRRPGMDEVAFLAAMRRLRTIFYSNNPAIVRKSFEQALLARLDAKFQKKTFVPDETSLAAIGIAAARPSIASPPMSSARTEILALLTTSLTLTELATKAKKKDSTIHHHVKALTTAGLVVRERAGRFVRYRRA